MTVIVATYDPVIAFRCDRKSKVWEGRLRERLEAFPPAARADSTPRRPRVRPPPG